MFTYNASNPYFSTEKKFSSLWSWFNYESIGNIVVPAQSREKQTLDTNELNSFATLNDLSIELGKVNTYDAAQLDTIEMKPLTELSKPLVEQHFIIKFNGNGMHYEDALQNYVHDAKKLGLTVISFNYRGVGNSVKKPNTFQELITDGIAQVQRLLDRGIDSEKITLDGLSLGGAVATMVASHFHKLGKPVFLWNDRSFASISKTAAGIITPKTENIFNNVLSYSCESTIWCAMSLTNWECDIAKTYQSISEKYKSYAFVAKQSEHSSGDGVISHKASLHCAVKTVEKNKNQVTGHKLNTRSGFYNRGHNMSRTALYSSKDSSMTAQDLFEKFVENHISVKPDMNH